jgi:hypothetical protein
MLSLTRLAGAHTKTSRSLYQRQHFVTRHLVSFEVCTCSCSSAPGSIHNDRYQHGPLYSSVLDGQSSCHSHLYTLPTPPHPLLPTSQCAPSCLPVALRAYTTRGSSRFLLSRFLFFLLSISSFTPLPFHCIKTAGNANHEEMKQPGGEDVAGGLRASRGTTRHIYAARGDLALDAGQALAARHQSRLLLPWPARVSPASMRHSTTPNLHKSMTNRIWSGRVQERAGWQERSTAGGGGDREMRESRPCDSSHGRRLGYRAPDKPPPAPRHSLHEHAWPAVRDDNGQSCRVTAPWSDGR